MNILDDVALSNYSTMRLGGPAKHLAEVSSRQEIIDALAWAKERNLPTLMIGGGSNIVWQDSGFRGLVLVNKLLGYDDVQEPDGSHTITIGAGESWDGVVARSVSAGLTGIEALSLIPGTAGGTPIQNVGAYGQRISNVLQIVEAYDTHSDEFVTIAAADCAFSYRDSRFKSADRGRFYITALHLRLQLSNPQPPYYIAIDEYLRHHQVEQPLTPATLRDVVIAIRREKLPDPAVVANNGSFFANPIISADAAKQLQSTFPDIPCWPGDNGTYKVPAAWLIEHVGMKGVRDTETGMATWENHALVLVNEHAKSTADLLRFRQKLIDAVETTFHITLEQEPELLP